MRPGLKKQLTLYESEFFLLIVVAFEIADKCAGHSFQHRLKI